MYELTTKYTGDLLCCYICQYLIRMMLCTSGESKLQNYRYSLSNEYRYNGKRLFIEKKYLKRLFFHNSSLKNWKNKT